MNFFLSLFGKSLSLINLFISSVANWLIATLYRLLALSTLKYPLVGELEKFILEQGLEF